MAEMKIAGHRCKRGRGFVAVFGWNDYWAMLENSGRQTVPSPLAICRYPASFGDPSKPSSAHSKADLLAPDSSNPAPDPPAGLAGASPEPRRSTSYRG